MTQVALAMRLFAPQLIVAITGAVVLLADLVWPHTAEKNSPRPWLAYLGIAGLALAALFAVARSPEHATVLWGTMVFDPVTVLFDLLFLGVGVAALLVSIDSLPDFSSAPAEYYTLVIWCTLGSMLIAPAADLFTLFLCLQLTSLPLVVLIGYAKNDPRSGEAALKYLMVALVATALFLFGISFVYGALGTSSFAGIEAALASGDIQPVVMVGLVLMLAGVGFKTTSAPFQYWVPDVYEGAPSPVTAFVSVGSKLTGFALVLRFVVTALGANPDLRIVFAVLAALSMTLGNLGALQQTNIKRLLAYSGIAQAGYILVGLAAVSTTGTAAVLFYLVAYAIGNVLAFSVVIAFVKATGSEHVADYAGLARRSPLAAFGLTLALLSLAGLPLTVGFMAKFYAFLSAAQAGLLWLVLLAVANTVLAFSYYLRIVWMLYVEESDAEPVTVPTRLAVTTFVCSVGVVAVGVFPGPLLAVTTHAAGVLFGI